MFNTGWQNQVSLTSNKHYFSDGDNEPNTSRLWFNENYTNGAVKTQLVAVFKPCPVSTNRGHKGTT